MSENPYESPQKANDEERKPRYRGLLLEAFVIAALIGLTLLTLQPWFQWLVIHGPHR